MAILRSGTWHLVGVCPGGVGASHTGGWEANSFGGFGLRGFSPGGPGNQKLGDATFVGETHLYLDSDVAPTLPADLPVGFSLRDSFGFFPPITTFLPGVTGITYDNWTTIDFDALGVTGMKTENNADTVTITPPPNADSPFTIGVTGWPLVGMTLLLLIGLDGFPCIVGGYAEQDRPSADAAHVAIPGDGVWTIAGAYDILGDWWTTCDQSHLQLPSVDPAAPWVKLAVAPTPIIGSVTPSHGGVAGGTAFVIDGSGFGDACVVTFDGVPVTSQVVVSQYKITGVTAAHGAGSVSVVVTNEDGVTS